MAEFLRRIQEQSAEMVPFEQFGLTEIMRMGPEVRETCGFQNLLVIQPTSTGIIDGDNGVGLFLKRDYSPEMLEFALTMECRLNSCGVQLCSRYDSSMITTVQMERLTKQFQHVLQQLIAEEGLVTIGEITAMSPSDLRDILRLNQVRPVASHQRLQDKFYLRVKDQPELPAVHAWDGKLSYRQLHILSSRLARHLVGLGVGRGKYVAVCFEKSVWAVVAMLAVFIAGGACVPVDPSHPRQRLQNIIDVTATRQILCSPTQAPLLEGVTERIVVVDHMLF